MLAGPIDEIALRAAERIEDEFAQGHTGGVTQRRAKVQNHVIRAIREALDHAAGGLAATLESIGPDRE